MSLALNNEEDMGQGGGGVSSEVSGFKGNDQDFGSVLFIITTALNTGCEKSRPFSRWPRG